MIIILKTKLKKITEEELEMEDRDLGTMVNKETTWVWRRRGFRADDILDVVAFDPTTSLVSIYDYHKDNFYKVLVRHKFDEVMKKWEDALVKASQWGYNLDGGDDDVPDDQEPDTSEGYEED